jgi:DNA-3-methyladenine glycosylase I
MAEQKAQLFQIRPLGDSEGDRDWVQRFIAAQWGADEVVVHDTVYHPARLPGFVAWQAGVRVGLVTFFLDDEACEIVTLDSQRRGSGVGTALLEAVKGVAQVSGCRRLWLITTNDNLDALRFYQKRGFALVAVHRNAVERARQTKPEIPLVGQHGIPLRDEIELDIPLE